MAEEKPMSGWLEKKGEVNTAWKKRWFDVKSDRVEYRKGPEDSQSKGAILLAGAIVQLHPPKEGQWQQRLSIEDKSSGRTYWLRGNLNNLREWNTALNTQITRLAAGGAARSASTSSASAPAPAKVGESSSDSEDEDLAASTLGSVIREGMLEKKGEKRKAWQSRWFRLYTSQLAYFKSKDDSLPRGRIPLVSAVVELLRGEGDTTEIHITPANTNRTFVLRITDEHRAKEWHMAIRSQTRPPVTKPTTNTSASAEALKAHAQKYNEKEGKQVQLSSSSHLAEVQVMEEAASLDEELEQRHDGIMQLEKDMTELNAIFKDMAGIVREQGDSLNTIESNISKTVEHSEFGLQEIRRADELQSKRFWRFGGPAKEK